ncbi:hypothetical protein C0J52_21905 [Blattella germanica]|nr:hypothetical protein C0J52_21905 [Blattella germanica]
MVVFNMEGSIRPDEIMECEEKSPTTTTDTTNNTTKIQQNAASAMKKSNILDPSLLKQTASWPFSLHTDQLCMMESPCELPHMHSESSGGFLMLKVHIHE